jgi:hypothetical protein
MLKRDGGEGMAGTVPTLAQEAAASLLPMHPGRLRQKLTLIGAAMAPNRSQDDAAAWLHLMTAGLRDLPEDMIMAALDRWVKTSKFPPTVAELREWIEPALAAKRRDAARLDAMARLIASGAHIPAAPPAPPPFEHVPAFREEDRCTPEQAAEVMAEFPNLKSETRERLRGFAGPPRRPTEADYAELLKGMGR